MAERILVTGSTGFVGTYLMKALRQKWPAAQILGFRSDPASPGIPDERYELVDLLDAASVGSSLATFSPDLVVHLAAQSSVARGVNAADLTWHVNLSGSLSLALAVARHAAEASLLFASTSEVYGASFLDSPVDETSLPRPMNAYAKSKLAAERMFADVLPKSCRLIVARPFNHTGPGQRRDFVLPSFAGQIALIEASKQDARVEVGNLDVRRDFLDVRDVVEAYVVLCDAMPRLPLRLTVNIASGQPRGLRDLLQILRGLSARPFEIAVDPERLRPIDLPLAYARPDLIRALTGWQPVRPITETLADLLAAARHSISS